LLRFGGDDCGKRASGAFGAPVDCGNDINATTNWRSLEGKVTAVGSLDRAGMTLRQAECHYHIRVWLKRRQKITKECSYKEQDFWLTKTQHFFFKYEKFYLF
jgi:hypothetical protein